MNTQHLRYAIEVERTGSISQAAENLFIGQPTLSKVIKELEDSLGFAIFARTSRGTIATEKGALFLKYAKSVLAQVEKMESLGQPDDPSRQEFCVSLPHADYILRATVKFTAELDPEAAIYARIRETDAIQAIQDVQEGRSSLGVIRLQVAHESYFSDFLTRHELDSQIIWEFEPLLVMAENSPLAGIDRLDEDILKNYIEVVSGDDYVPYLSGSDRDAEARARQIIAINTKAERLELVSLMPKTYIWSSPMPAERLTRYGLVQRRCPYSTRKYRDALIFRKGSMPSQLEKKFINLLFAAKNEVAFQPLPM